MCPALHVMCSNSPQAVYGQPNEARIFKAYTIRRPPPSDCLSQPYNRVIASSCFSRSNVRNSTFVPAGS